VPAEFAPLLEFELGTLAESAFWGGVSVLADGVYSAVPVTAFEPAEEDPDAANEVAAPEPVAAADAFD